MAASSPVIYQGDVVGVIRYVTSLSAIDRQFTFSMTVIAAIALAIFAMVYFSKMSAAERHSPFWIVSAQPVMAVRGVRSSWETEEINSLWVFSACLSAIDRQFTFSMTVIAAIALAIFAMVYFCV